MTTTEDLIQQLQATRDAAVAANDEIRDVRRHAMRPPMDEDLVTACEKAAAEYTTVIAACDAAIVEAIVNRPGFKAFLAALEKQTQRMTDETEALARTVEGLEKLKRAAKAVTKVLGFIA